jgi:hypothetical protein
LYVEGDVRFVNAVEFGADAIGSRRKSCGETVSNQMFSVDNASLLLGVDIWDSRWPSLFPVEDLSNASDISINRDLLTYCNPEESDVSSEIISSIVHRTFLNASELSFVEPFSLLLEPAD